VAVVVAVVVAVGVKNLSTDSGSSGTENATA